MKLLVTSSDALVTTSKAPVTSVALVTSSFFSMKQQASFYTASLLHASFKAA